MMAGKQVKIRGLIPLVAASLLLSLSSCGSGDQAPTVADINPGINDGQTDTNTNNADGNSSSSNNDDTDNNSGVDNTSSENTSNEDSGIDNSEDDLTDGSIDGGIVRLSFTQNQEELNDHVLSASRFDITNDGRYLLFSTKATNVVDDDGPADTFSDVYLRDTVSGSVTKISRAATGAVNNEESFAESISDDGRYAIFKSASTGIHPDANGSTQIYLYDALSDTIELISRDLADDAGRGNSYYAYISADGGTVIFTSRAANIVNDLSGTVSGNTSVIVAYDLQSGTMSSVGNSGGDVRDVSSDARYVLFIEDGAYVFDRQTDSQILVENANTFLMAVSDDGRYVAFTKSQTNTATRVDLQQNTEITIGLNALMPPRANSDLNRRVSVQQISGDGQTILYYGLRYDGDVPARSDRLHWDAYAINVSDPQAQLISQSMDQFNAASNGVSGGNRKSLHSQFFNDDQSVLFYSEATDLVVGDTNFRGDLFSTPLK